MLTRQWRPTKTPCVFLRALRVPRTAGDFCCLITAENKQRTETLNPYNTFYNTRKVNKKKEAEQSWVWSRNSWILDRCCFEVFRNQRGTASWNSKPVDRFLSTFPFFFFTVDIHENLSPCEDPFLFVLRHVNVIPYECHLEVCELLIRNQRGAFATFIGESWMRIAALTDNLHSSCRLTIIKGKKKNIYIYIYIYI